MPEKWVTFFPNFQLNLPRCDLWPWLPVLCYDTTYPELGCQCCAGRNQSLASVLPGQASPASSVPPFLSWALDPEYPNLLLILHSVLGLGESKMGSVPSEFVQLHFPALLHHCLSPCQIGTQRCLEAAYACSNQCKRGFENFSLFLIVIFRSPSLLLAQPCFSVVLGFGDIGFCAGHTRGRNSIPLLPHR